MSSSELRSIVAGLLSDQKLAVLATCGEQGPHTSLVAFASPPDLKTIYFATARATRKFSNLMQCPRVSVLIDSRVNRASDFQDAVAVTASGSASEVTDTQASEVFIEKNPGLKEFMQAPDTALVEIRVERYQIVSNFREVDELKMSHGESSHQ